MMHHPLLLVPLLAGSGEFFGGLAILLGSCQTQSPLFPLTIVKAGDGAGTVTSAPAGIDCGASCAATYGYGQTVVLTASPSVSSDFVGWSDASCAGTAPCSWKSLTPGGRPGRRPRTAAGTA